MPKLSTIAKFEQLADIFRKQIRLGTWKTGEKLPGERTLARQHSVAHLTVNKAVAGLVAEGLLERRIGDGTYVCEHASPSTLSQTVVAMVDTRSERHDPFLNALPSFLQGNSFYPMLLHWEAVLSDPQPLARLLNDAPAAFVANGRCGLPVETLLNCRPPIRVVVLGNSSQGACVPGSYILNDFAASGRMAAEHLLQTGCRRLLVLGPPDAANTVALSRDSFLHTACEVITRSGASLEIVSAAQMTDDDYREIFRRRQPPDGILSANDFRLVAAVAAARHVGRAVPEEVRAVGLYNTPWAAMAGLSSVALDIPAMLEHLQDILAGGEDRIVALPPRLVVRQSTSTGQDSVLTMNDKPEV